MISWSYYGFQGWAYLFGRSKRMEYAYKVIFCVFVVIGAAASLGSVIGFSDAMVFAQNLCLLSNTSEPNLLQGVYFSLRAVFGHMFDVQKPNLLHPY